jgi:hypothetical protein
MGRELVTLLGVFGLVLDGVLAIVLPDVFGRMLCVIVLTTFAAVGAVAIRDLHGG